MSRRAGLAVQYVKTAEQEAEEYARLITGRSGKVEGDYLVYCRPADDLADFGSQMGSFPRERKTRTRHQFRATEPALVRFLAAVTYAKECAAENPGWIAEVAIERDGEADQDTIVCFSSKRTVAQSTRLVMRGAVAFTDGWGQQHWRGSWGPDDVARLTAVLAIIANYEVVPYVGRRKKGV